MSPSPHPTPSPAPQAAPQAAPAVTGADTPAPTRTIHVGDGAAGPGRGRAGGLQRGAHAGLDGGRVEPAAT